MTVTAAWASSDSSVGSITAAPTSPAGRLSGRVHGTVLLSVSHEGRTGSKSVNVVNSYGGNWSGSYTLTACDASGSFVQWGWCRGKVGATVSMGLELVQSGSDSSQIKGTLSNGIIRFAPVTGSVTPDGRLVLTTDMQWPGRDGLAYRYQLGGWETQPISPPPSGAPQMSGRTAATLSGFGRSGNAYEEHRITSLVNTAAQTAQSE